MNKTSTVRVERPPVSRESTYTAIPFGLKIRTQRAAAVKVLAAVTRASWIDPDGRRITRASNRDLAKMAAVADPQTIAKHLAELAEAGVVTIERASEERVVVVHERAEDVGGQFVILADSHPAWALRPGPFALFLAVRSFDFLDTGRSWPKNTSLAKLLNWSERAVERAMAALRSSGTVTTVSIFNPSKRTRKRMIYAPNPTPNPERIGPGGYEKAGHLYGHDEVRKNDGCTYEKMTGAPTKNCRVPLRKSGALNQNSEEEFLRATRTTNQAKFADQSESEPGAEAEVVVVAETTSTDTNPAPAPDTLAEVVAMLAKSGLDRQEQERYLKIARSLAASDNPPPIAWHRHVLDVKPSTGMISLAGIIIARLKAWTTTPPEKRAAIVEEIESRDAEAIAKRLKSARFWYDGYLGRCKANPTDITPAEVRRSWERLNAALKAAGQPAVQLDAAVIRAEHEAEQRERERAEMNRQGAELAREVARINAGSKVGQIDTPTPPPAPTPPSFDPAELARLQREKAEAERQRERSRIEAEQNKEIANRIKAFENRELMLLSMNHTGSLDDAITRWRSTTLPAKRAEIEAAVRAEFAPRLAALAPPPSRPVLAVVRA